jgi:glycosyltransferase involved in cell wall biosynthesis
MTPTLDVLIPTYQRPAALAVTMATLIGQTFHDFRVVVADQTETFDVENCDEVLAVTRVLRFHGCAVEFYKNLPRRGMAQQRQFLLDQASAPYALFIDDDLILEPDALERLLTAIREEGCGFVGCAVPGLSFINDVRPHQQFIEFWEGAVQPEVIRPNTAEWERHKLHSAANILHVARQMNLSPETQRKYRLAWVGACVLYDTAKLRASGGFDFWEQLPTEHAGEDVLAQVRVMERYGGCGIIPTRVYHQEHPTTIPNRQVDAPKVLL